MRRILGCPEDKIEVYVCDTPTNRFNVVLQIRMFQKSLRTADGNHLTYEFVLGGRIWWFRFGIDEDGRCSTAIGLQQYSHPARPDAVLSIEVHNWTQAYGVTPCEALKIPLSLTGTQILVPWLSTNGCDCRHFLPSDKTWKISNQLGGDWIMHDNTEYVDHEGTLHAKLEITLL